MDLILKCLEDEIVNKELTDNVIWTKNNEHDQQIF